jgi:SAM-dependent methyltransferase
MEIPPVALLKRIALPDHEDPARWFNDSGRAHKDSIVRALPGDWTWRDKRVLDFGCGVGRILRHFATEARETRLFAACDIDAPSAAWLAENYGDRFDVHHTAELPPLPWADGTFDLIYAGSVFTHLTDAWAQWLAEVHRLLAPRGLAFITLISGAFAERQTGEPWDADRVGMNVLFWGQDWEHWGPAVLHSEWWIRSHWGRGFEIVRFAADGFDGSSEDPHAGQGWTLIRRGAGSITPEALEAIDPSEPREWRALRHNLRQVQQEAMRFRTECAALSRRVDVEREAKGDVERALERLRRLRSVRAALRLSRIIGSLRPHAS